MDTGTVTAIIAVVVICFLVFQKAKHRQEGSTVKRPLDFVEYSETFTLRHVSDEEFLAAVKRTPLTAGTGESFHGTAAHVSFEGPFEAVLERAERTDDKTVYIFFFTHWNSRYGIPTNGESMNLLLTAVEKLFVALDPNTLVVSKKEDVTTKRHIL